MKPLHKQNRSSKVGENQRTWAKTVCKQNLAFPHVTQARLEPQRYVPTTYVFMKEKEKYGPVTSSPLLFGAMEHISLTVYVILYQQPGSSNLIGWKLEMGMAS